MSYNFLPAGYEEIEKEQREKEESKRRKYIRPSNIEDHSEMKFRLLSYPLIYWQDWTQSKQPVRFQYHKKPLASIDPDRPIQECWSFVIWNYALETEQILTVHQKGIRTALREILMDDSWGGLWNFDLKIKKASKSGKSGAIDPMDIAYTVLPCMTKKLPFTVERELLNNPICLQALMENENPWCYVGEPTKLYFSEADSEEAPSTFDQPKVVGKASNPGKSSNPNQDLLDRLNSCDPGFRDNILKAITAPGTKGEGEEGFSPDLSDLTPALVDRIESAIVKEQSRKKSA